MEDIGMSRELAERAWGCREIC